MARYKLMSKCPEFPIEAEVRGQRKSTKAEIELWCQDNIRACGLDWRVGFSIKFKGSRSTYTWRNIKDGSEVVK